LIKIKKTRSSIGSPRSRLRLIGTARGSGHSHQTLSFSLSSQTNISPSCGSLVRCSRDWGKQSLTKRLTGYRPPKGAQYWNHRRRSQAPNERRQIRTTKFPSSQQLERASAFTAKFLTQATTKAGVGSSILPCGTRASAGRRPTAHPQLTRPIAHRCPSCALVMPPCLPNCRSRPMKHVSSRVMRL